MCEYKYKGFIKVVFKLYFPIEIDSHEVAFQEKV